MLLVAVSIADCPVQIVTELLFTETEGMRAAVIAMDAVAVPQLDVVTVALYTPPVVIGRVEVVAVPVLHTYVPILPDKDNVAVAPPHNKLLVVATDNVGVLLTTTLTCAVEVLQTLDADTVYVPAVFKETVFVFNPLTPVPLHVYVTAVLALAVTVALCPVHNEIADGEILTVGC